MKYRVNLHIKILVFSVHCLQFITIHSSQDVLHYTASILFKHKTKLKYYSGITSHQPAIVLVHSSSSEIGIFSHQQQTAPLAHLSVAEVSEVQGHCPYCVLDCAVLGKLQESRQPLYSWHTVLQPITEPQNNQSSQQQTGIFFFILTVFKMEATCNSLKVLDSYYFLPMVSDFPVISLILVPVSQ